MMKAWERFQQIVYMTNVKHEDLFDIHVDAVCYAYGPCLKPIEAAFDKLMTSLGRKNDDDLLWSKTDLELAKQQIIDMMKKADI